MATTSQQVPAATTSTAVDPGFYDETRLGIADKKPDGSPRVKIVTEKAYNEALEEAQKDASGATEAPTKVREPQTFRFRYPVGASYEELMASMQSLIPNVAEAQDIIYRGSILKQQKAANDFLASESYAPIEGVYDLGPALAAATERKRATPLEKISKNITELSASDLQVLMARIQELAAQQS